MQKSLPTMVSNTVNFFVLVSTPPTVNSFLWLMALAQRFETKKLVYHKARVLDLRAVGFLKNAKSFLPRDFLKTLHTGIVKPNFDNVALFGYAQAQLKLTSCKKNRNELQEL